MKLDRRQFVTATGMTGIAGLAGCTGGPSGGNGGDGNGGGGGDVAGHIGMVYATGGLGDGSFNDQAQQGVKQAESELSIQYQEAQPEQVSDFKNLQRQFAQSSDPNYDLVSCIGFLQADALS